MGKCSSEGTYPDVLRCRDSCLIVILASNIGNSAMTVAVSVKSLACYRAASNPCRRYPTEYGWSGRLVNPPPLIPSPRASLLRLSLRGMEGSFRPPPRCHDGSGFHGCDEFGGNCAVAEVAHRAAGAATPLQVRAGLTLLCDLHQISRRIAIFCSQAARRPVPLRGQLRMSVDAFVGRLRSGSSPAGGPRSRWRSRESSVPLSIFIQRRRN